MCYDELYDREPLTMNEIEYAFAKAKASGAMKAPFDIAFYMIIKCTSNVLNNL